MFDKGPAPSDPDVARDDAAPVAWSLIVLIVLGCGVELALALADFGVWGTVRLRQSAYEYFGFWPGLLQNWAPNYPLQPYVMFLTYAFFHAGLLHLLVNMITLWSLGKAVLNRVGALSFLIIYLLSVIGGACGYALLASGLQPMVGASGALFGLAGALLAWLYVDQFTYRRGLLPIAQAVVVLILLNLVLWWAMDGQLAWQTHLGGFISGWIAALLVDPRAVDRSAE